MNNDPVKPSQKKVFDITRPGKVVPSSSSRPVIVGHKPHVKDYQMVEQQPSLSPKITINPPADTQPEAVADPPVSTAQPLGTLALPEETITGALPETASPDKTTPEVPGFSNEELAAALMSETPPTQTVTPTDSVGAGVGQPIISQHKEGMGVMTIVLIIVLILVIVAVLDIFLDMGIIKTSLNIPHTHLLKGS